MDRGRSPEARAAISEGVKRSWDRSRVASHKADQLLAEAYDRARAGDDGVLTSLLDGAIAAWREARRV